jgi:hypothetical protein
VSATLRSLSQPAKQLDETQALDDSLLRGFDSEAGQRFLGVFSLSKTYPQADNPTALAVGTALERLQECPEELASTTFQQDIEMLREQEGTEVPTSRARILDIAEAASKMASGQALPTMPRESTGSDSPVRIIAYALIGPDLTSSNG